jgi:hypothetical protein
VPKFPAILAISCASNCESNAAWLSPHPGGAPPREELFRLHLRSLAGDLWFCPTEQMLDMPLLTCALPEPYPGLLQPTPDAAHRPGDGGSRS